MFALIDNEDLELIQRYKWHANSNPSTVYATASVDGKHIDMHRLIMRAKKGQSIDHRNCKGLDNRKRNLRFATAMENQQNSRANRNTSSKFKGVYSFRNKWVAKIRVKKIRYYLGIFNEERNAAIAYDLRAIECFGEFARLNILENLQNRSQVSSSFP